MSGDSNYPHVTIGTAMNHLASAAAWVGAFSLGEMPSKYAAGIALHDLDVAIEKLHQAKREIQQNIKQESEAA